MTLGKLLFGQLNIHGGAATGCPPVVSRIQTDNLLVG